MRAGSGACWRGTPPRPCKIMETAPLPTPSLAKRIKRHVIGPPRTFFASTAPGLEKILLQDLLGLGLPLEQYQLVGGGVEFTAKIHCGYLANLRLRTADRILMRVATFKASNFRQLRRKAHEIPWELYLNPALARRFTVSVNRSRLYHSGAIRTLLEECLQARLGPPGQVEEAMIFVRALEDRFTVSLDTSGALLHKRGLKPHGHEAPLRETYAAAALLAAGYDGRWTVLDPMCGAGTFSLEAALMAANIPPGWFRSFAFFHWPAFRPARWEYVRRESAKQFRPPPRRPRILASDNSRLACRRLAETLQAKGLTPWIDLHARDFFDIRPERLTRFPGLVTLNPPFGRRLSDPDAGARFFAEICAKLAADFRGWHVAMIVPRAQPLDALPFRPRTYSFVHGGLDVTLATGRL